MVFHIGCNAQAVQRDKNAFVKYLDSVGLDTHEEADVCTECVGLGDVVDGKRREARPRAERVNRLRKAIFGDHSRNADLMAPAGNCCRAYCFHMFNSAV